VDLPGIIVLRSFDWLRFFEPATLSEPTPPAIQIGIPGKYSWGGGYVCLEFAERAQSEANCASLKTQGLSELSPLELRSWRAGDRYRPALGSREYTIQELFQRARVPSWRRHTWPIISMGPKILWVRQFGAAAEFMAQNEAGSVLQIWEESGK
jgi:tRNA(Ile)-lysidine synthetase-like protein